MLTHNLQKGFCQKLVLLAKLNIGMSRQTAVLCSAYFGIQNAHVTSQRVSKEYVNILLKYIQAYQIAVFMLLMFCRGHFILRFLMHFTASQSHFALFTVT